MDRVPKRGRTGGHDRSNYSEDQAFYGWPANCFRNPVVADSRYVMAAENVGFWSVLTHLNKFLNFDDSPFIMLIYRISDGASLERFWFFFDGENDRGYYWISDYRAFLKSAALPPVVKPCP